MNWFFEAIGVLLSVIPDLIAGLFGLLGMLF
jgi:hypothetical protein